MTKEQYAEYKGKFEAFMKREGITNLSGVVDEAGNTITNGFSWRPCECCQRPLGGSRTRASGYHPDTKSVLEYEICEDCEYYAAYGQLDDQTMLDMESEVQS